MTLTAIEPGGCAPPILVDFNTSGIAPVDVKIIIKPDEVVKRIGSIELPDSAIDQAKYAGTRGTLVAKGPNAFVDWGEGNAPSIGQRVLYAQYSGRRVGKGGESVNFKGDDSAEFLIMNDEDVVGLCVA